METIDVMGLIVGALCAGVGMVLIVAFLSMKEPKLALIGAAFGVLSFYMINDVLSKYEIDTENDTKNVVFHGEFELPPYVDIKDQYVKLYTTDGDSITLDIKLRKK